MESSLLKVKGEVRTLKDLADFVGYLLLKLTLHCLFKEHECRTANDREYCKEA